MFVVNVKDGACLSYYNQNPRHDHVGNSLLFCRSVKILNDLKYFCLCTFAHHMSLDTVLTARVMHRCFELDLEKTAVSTGFVSYDICTGEVSGLVELCTPAAKQTRSNDVVPSAVLPTAVPLLFCESVEQTALEAIGSDYSKYWVQTERCGEASGRGDEEKLDLNALLGKDLL